MIFSFSHTPKIMVLLSTLLVSIYFLLFKKAPKQTLIMYFWIHVFFYAAFSAIYFYKEVWITSDKTALESLILDTTYHNLPFFLISALCSLCGYVIFDFLMKKYSISMILSLSQLSIIITTIGYIILGAKTSLISIFGITIIFLGSLFSGLKNFSLKNPLAAFKNYDLDLLSWSFIKALCYSATVFITYICISKYNDTTKAILHEVTSHLRFLPCMHITPIHLNIGVQFLTIITLFLFITYYLKDRSSILPIFFQHHRLILGLSLLYVIQAYLYYESYDFIKNKNLITAITQLYLPCNVLGSYLIYRQTFRKEEVIGMATIVLGSIISIFG